MFVYVYKALIQRGLYEAPTERQLCKALQKKDLQSPYREGAFLQTYMHTYICFGLFSNKYGIASQNSYREGPLQIPRGFMKPFTERVWENPQGLHEVTLDKRLCKIPIGRIFTDSLGALQINIGRELHTYIAHFFLLAPIAEQAL